ncbi:MAG: CBS domain-containing protein [Planctomycetota bacterium]|nr:CBS domain-containing protein [Planctomycetota bacterium]
MPTVSSMLENKGRHVWTIGPDQTVFDALLDMAEHGVGALVVVEHDQVVGILSERDYARKIILFNRTSRTTLVREIMTAPVVTCGLDWDAQRCMRVMTERRFRHLPVLEDGRLAGIVSIGDVVKSIIQDQQFTIEQLAAYMQMAPAG